MRKRSSRRTVAGVLVAVLTAAGVQALGSGPAWAQSAATGAPVSNAFAMGGGIGGQIDQRTGAFQASIPLLNIAGRASSDLSMSLSYDQNLAAQGAAGNRFGLGSGWAIGLPWVDTAGTVRVYAASGGSFLYDTGSPTGLHDYPQRDLTFTKVSGTLPARPGMATARGYTYTLVHHDGTTDYFDGSGNLLEQADRFGNLIDLSWKQSGPSWQPTAAVDNDGDVTTFDYGAPGQVKVTAPANAEGITASTTLAVQAGLLRTVTDALGQTTSFAYVTGGGPTGQLLRTVSAPNGSHTLIDYTPLALEPSVVVVKDVQVTDATGTAVQTQRTFNADPPGNLDHHNYTGYPTYNNTAGSDGLFDSGDKNYRYSTTLSDGRSSVTETYNSLHLLVTRSIRVSDPVRGSVLQSTQTYGYPDVATVRALPANYAKPTAVTVVYGDPVYGATRTTRSSSAFDDQGQLRSTTDETGTTTSTVYDARFGVPQSETVTGADGTTSVTTNTLTADGRAIHSSTRAVGSAQQTPTARTVTTFSYDGSGQVTGQSVTWAPGAKPAGPSGGPDRIDTTRTITVDTAARTRTVVETTAAGTVDAAATTTVTDLVTGNVLSTTDADRLTTTYRYDALGRVTTQTAPGNRTMTTRYPSPLVTDVTDPTGHTTETTRDVLGRTVRVTDNVSGERLVPAVTARTVTVNTYSPDGAVATTTPATGVTTATTFDPLQRPIKVVKPDGLTQLIAYDDVAHSRTTSILPIATQVASAVTVDRYDDLARTLGSATTYQDQSPQTPSTTSYDGLGRPSGATSDDLTATPDYRGAGGLQNTLTLSPTNTATFPGGTTVADTDNTLTGALAAKTLTNHASTGTTSTAGASFTYDAAGRVSTVTDPGGAATSYTYTPAGRTRTVTSPSGAVATYTYSPTTGQVTEDDQRGADGTTLKTAYTYVASSGLIATVYDPDHPTNVLKYQYDADGHKTAVQYPDGTTTTAQYLDNGELHTTTDVTGAVTTYRYDATGLVGGATQARGGTQIATVSYTYDSLDRVHTLSRGDGATTTITYDDANRVTDETTTSGATAVRADTYTYDAHGNTSTHTTTAGPTSTTYRYGYDAYNRLISSATYPNATGAGTPSTTLRYTLDAGGDITQLSTTASGAVTTTVNTIDPRGQLTTRTVDGKATNQTYYPDGTVKQDLNGNTFRYNLADQPTAVTTPDGAATSYTYWPDGTRRSATTTLNGATNTTTLHYDTTGAPANDTYTDGTGSNAQTASYLIGLGRESRSLTNGGLVRPPAPRPAPCDKKNKKGCPAPGGAGAAGPDAPSTLYYLDDAHGSTVAMIDRTGAVTTSYTYSDYGQVLQAGTAPVARKTVTDTSAALATVNPFTFNSTYTDPVTGTQVLPARIYDPTQARFLSLDGANLLNRYQAFDTNPVDKADPTGHAAVSTIVTAAVTAALFLAFLTSIIPVVNVLTGTLAVAELSTAATVTLAANAAVAATSFGAFATSLTLAADDGVRQRDGKGFLSAKQRQSFQTATTALGIASAVFGIGGAGLAGLASSGSGAEAASVAATETPAEATTGTNPFDSPDPGAYTTAGTTELQTSQDVETTVYRTAEESNVKNSILEPQDDVFAAGRTSQNWWSTGELKNAAGGRVLDIFHRDFAVLEGDTANIARFNSKIAWQNARIVNELARIYGPDPEFEAQLAEASGMARSELQIEGQTATLDSAPDSASAKMTQPDPSGELSPTPTTAGHSPFTATLGENMPLNMI